MTENTNTHKPVQKRTFQRLSTLTMIILAANMIPLLLMGFGIFYLDKYKQNLIEFAYLDLQKEATLLSYFFYRDSSALDDLNDADVETVMFVINEDGSVYKQIGNEERL